MPVCLLGDLGPDTQAYMAFFTRKKPALFHSEPYTRPTSETAQAPEPGSQDGSEPFSLTPPPPTSQSNSDGQLWQKKEEQDPQFQIPD